MTKTGFLNSITDVPGISVGNYTDYERLSGLTVVLAEEGSIAGVDVRGGSPGTRETDLLDPVNRIARVDAVALCGGSAYGLDAVTGVMRYLEERGKGHPTREGMVVPIVPAAVIYDLDRGDRRGKISGEEGYKACNNSVIGRFKIGNVGAGTGAVSGSVKGGLGTASTVMEDDIIIGALAAVNSSGSTFDPSTGAFYARHLELDEEFGDLNGDLNLNPPAYSDKTPALGGNTTIAVVACNAMMSKTQATKMAQMAQDGLARAIYPAHTPFDGDTVFSISTGKLGSPSIEVSERRVNRYIGMVGSYAADTLSRAIIHAILSAETVREYQCYRDKYPEGFKPQTTSS
ncbi:MAG: P1 family peptidase [Candidatus Bathyarchaeia archaeon]